MNYRKELREKIASEVVLFKILGGLQGICLLVLVSSPVLLIWLSWSITWKVGLTALCLLLLIYFVYELLLQTFVEEVEKTIEEKLKK